MREVVVLMSVYNGEKYLRPQIDSIRAQQDVSVRIVVRDDGSNDRTQEILTGYCDGSEAVTCIAGHNLGPASSFAQLVNTCDLDSEYYAFSDADDVWEQDKLITAVRALEEPGIPTIPLVYCSRLKLVDENLTFLGLTRTPKKPPAFANALVETVTSGNTIVLNRPAFKLLRSVPANDIVMHDAWVYLVVSAFGRILFDESAKILYRQHCSNVFGGSHGFAKRWKLRLGKLVSKQDFFYRQAKQFHSLYYDRLDKSDQEILLRYLNYRSSLMHRLAFALSPTVYRQRALSNMFMRLLILFRRL